MHEIARYTRRLPVSLERIFENALDWEQLPHLHRNTFKDATVMASADDFWEARLQLRGLGGRTQVVRLTLSTSSEASPSRRKAPGGGSAVAALGPGNAQIGQDMS